jgi:hypothetical protein
MKAVHYFPGLAVAETDLYVPEADPATDWDMQPAASAHYFPSSPMGLDNDLDGLADGIVAPPTTPQIMENWVYDLTPLQKISDEIAYMVAHF